MQSPWWGRLLHPASCGLAAVRRYLRSRSYPFAIRCVNVSLCERGASGEISRRTARLARRTAGDTFNMVANLAKTLQNEGKQGSPSKGSGLSKGARSASIQQGKRPATARQIASKRIYERPISTMAIPSRAPKTNWEAPPHGSESHAGALER